MPVRGIVVPSPRPAHVFSDVRLIFGFLARSSAHRWSAAFNQPTDCKDVVREMPVWFIVNGVQFALESCYLSFFACKTSLRVAWIRAVAGVVGKLDGLV